MNFAILLSTLITATSPLQVNSAPAAVPAVALAQAHQAKLVHPARITVIAPELCGEAGTVHSVCGEVGWNGPLGAGGLMSVDIILPAALKFPMQQYMIQATANWDILAPPQTCIFTGQPVAPDAIQIIGTGCTLTEFAIAYTITGK